MRVSFACPACKQVIQAPPSLQGEAQDCPKCRAQIDSWPPPLPQAVPVVVLPPPPPAVWHYSVNGSRRGPVSVPQLKALAESGQLRPNDLVWRDGMPEWVEASRIPGLFPDQSTDPPPLPLAAPGRQEEEDDRPRKRRRKRRDEFEPATMAILILGTVFIPIVGIIVGGIGLSSASKKKRSQSGALVALGVFMVFAYLLSLNRR